MNDNWNEIKITVSVDDVETASNITNMVVTYGIYIEDYSNLEDETMEIAHIDLIEESLLQKDRTKAIIHVFISPEENPSESVSFIEERLDTCGIGYEIDTALCETKDWVNNWKKYFHPMPIGEKLLIRPIWRDDFDADGRKVLNIEPGLAFGTGSHPTTKLCLETLERYVNEEGIIEDDYRIEFFKEHLEYLYEGIKEGSNCFGFHSWTPIDCWSWCNAYKNRYGFISLDLETQKKTIKKSGKWICEVSKNNGF